MTAQAKVRLDRYERGICEHLIVHYGYERRAARLLVAAYLPVLRELDRYDSCRTCAERLHEARQNGLTPEDWLKRIRKIRSGAGRVDITAIGKGAGNIVAIR